MKKVMLAGLTWLIGTITSPGAGLAEDLWSLKPVARVEPPIVASAGAVRNPIDQFVLARLEKEGLSPSPEADRRTLIRRLTFDLHGLPPTPDEVDAFLHDTAPRAYERLVDRLLDSPRYGERWARHWLDIAHYADTHGFERDQRRDNAWRYRDYVIRSLNEDKPYDEFLREQIAGDVMDPNDPEHVIATGFLAAGPWDFVGQRETKSPELRRAARGDDLDDMVTQVMTSTMAMTVNCARCHDHKIDPIPQRDYYRLWSVFSGVRRDNRPVSDAAAEEHEARLAALKSQLKDVEDKLAELAPGKVHLAGIIAGGDGRVARPDAPKALDARNGRWTTSHAGFLKVDSVNTFQPVAESKFIDGVVIPDGGEGGQAAIPVTSTGITVTGIPDTSAATWDFIQGGTVQSQDFTSIDEIDYGSKGHSLIGIHANKAVTFDLAAIRETHGQGVLRFECVVGYGGKSPDARADAFVFVDGQLRARRLAYNHFSGGYAVAFDVTEDERFLTLMATDSGNGIGFDQVFFGDPTLTVESNATLDSTGARGRQRADLQARAQELREAIKNVVEVPQVYAVKSEEPETIHVLFRGNPEDPREEVTPGGLSAIAPLDADLGGPAGEGNRRLALARWITHPDNPLTRRVLVNRLWHYHFGRGLVDTPSDFGFGGGAPTHPELLDWLANRFLQEGWSLKAMHRLILNSATYRQSSLGEGNPAAGIDSDNRLLWRQNPRRLEAEVMRDSVLAVTGKLSLEMFGPGYRDFNYTEAYAPIYEYVTPDAPELWRRSIYRFVVRTTPQDFMTALDCPNPATLTPRRLTTTTALQSLALLNNDFMLKQSQYFADRLARDVPEADVARVDRAFRLAFGRAPDPAESGAALELVNRQGWFYLCRMLLNANEFIYFD